MPHVDVSPDDKTTRGPELPPEPMPAAEGDGGGSRLVLTIPEVAAALSIGTNLAYQMAAEGRLPTVHLGRRVLVPRAALERWLDGDKP